MIRPHLQPNLGMHVLHLRQERHNPTKRMLPSPHQHHPHTTQNRHPPIVTGLPRPSHLSRHFPTRPFHSKLQRRWLLQYPETHISLLVLRAALKFTIQWRTPFNRRLPQLGPHLRSKVTTTCSSSNINIINSNSKVSSHRINSSRKITCRRHLRLVHRPLRKETSETPVTLTLPVLEVTRIINFLLGRAVQVRVKMILGPVSTRGNEEAHSY